jgi:hypothetical protein
MCQSYSIPCTGRKRHLCCCQHQSEGLRLIAKSALSFPTTDLTEANYVPKRAPNDILSVALVTDVKENKLILRLARRCEALLPRVHGIRCLRWQMLMASLYIRDVEISQEISLPISLPTNKKTILAFLTFLLFHLS